MRITLDAQQATPLRKALIRDCAGQPWTIRVTPLSGESRVRLVLYLPRSALNRAMQRVAGLAPAAEISQLLEVPEMPTDAWSKVMRADAPHPDSHAPHHTEPAGGNTIADLLVENHVLLGLDVADRESLFACLAQFLEQHHGLAAASVIAGLAAREAMGSTALGQGVAVPHGQIKGLQEPLVLYVRPALPIPFDAPDGKPVSDLVALFVPEWANMTHLHLLAEVAERFCDQRFRDQLHVCENARAVCRLFVDFAAMDAIERGSDH
ncbi:PTS sugar transporter subunit IIA [Burkholderia ubonensis]|uniref:PTS sugar transporter subunit IIA n=1 Tax=Burkholderia ubonensis TaxID=101571 RepID=UPI001E565D31|nr:PTS sugar transporter subunit IIA [Burkholderia ubonensis]